MKTRMEDRAQPKGDPWAADKGWDSYLRSRMVADRRALADQDGWDSTSWL